MIHRDSPSDKTSDKEKKIAGHLVFTVSHCPMSDGYFKPCNDKNKELNFIVNQEKKVKDILKRLLKNEPISKSLYIRKLSPSGSKLRVLHGLAKIRKASVNGCPPFRPILSAISTPAYKLAKFLVPILSPLIVNKFTVKDSFQLLKKSENMILSSIWLAWMLILSLPTSLWRKPLTYALIHSLRTVNESII